MIVRDFPAAQYGVTRLCVKYYQIEDSPLSNTFSLSFPFWFNTEGFQIFYKRWRTENWYADADADEEPTELKKKKKTKNTRISEKVLWNETWNMPLFRNTFIWKICFFVVFSLRSLTYIFVRSRPFFSLCEAILKWKVGGLQ